MIDLAKNMGRLVMPRNQVAAFVIHGLMRLGNQVPRLRHLFEDLEIKPLNRFKAGCFVPPARAARLGRGQQMPQVWLKPEGEGPVVLSDDALCTGLAMIGFGVDPSALLSSEQVRAWSHAGGRFVQIDPRGHMATTSTLPRWEDITGGLMPSRVPVGWVALVRPDKVVMHDGPSTVAPQLLQRALEVLGVDRGADAGERSHLRA